ncbi:hypothetical protein ACFQXB_03040 [Plastorhodobacter daqingensis]|uniref:Uncharacterized protein n=1 Tax=Plastorhodobacter daqingensis TaxID=1387281 RepID=A0ABW2UID0_9RHOB
MPRFSAFLPLCLCLAGCAAPPDGDYPALVPLETLTARADDVSIAPATAETLEVRAAALRARAAALRRPVLHPDERSRLEGAR